MITVIIGTNAKSGSTAVIADTYIEELKKSGSDYQVLNLADLPSDFLHGEMYFNRSASFEDIQEKYLFPTEKYVLILPEYNGGIPGIFKLMIDASDITKAWWGKKAALCGLSAGRAGNLRGLDNLTNILNYLKVDVLKNKLPISRINEVVVDDSMVDEETKTLIQSQIRELLKF